MPEKVRAKFSVQSVTHDRHHVGTKDGAPQVMESATIKLAPVYHKNDPAHENTKFWNATPAGSIELQVTNPAAVALLEPGREFYVDFIPAS